MGYKAGTGKTGRINASGKYSLAFGEKTGVCIRGWADNLLTKLAAQAHMPKSEYVMRLIEKAADGATAAVVAITLGLMVADKSGIW